MFRKQKYIIVFFLFFSLQSVYAQISEQTMIAHFINVGQGDATLLEFPCGAILIDAGAQGPAQEQHLIDYLEAFFERRQDLNRTLDLVFVTHAHLDHNLALDNVANTFTIRRYIDNGIKVGSGKKNQNWLREISPERGITYSTYSSEDIFEEGEGEGITDTIIDPFDCSEIDPEVVLLSGRFTRRPAGWLKSEYENGNNHSLVISIKFGQASLLFTGDLEENGIETLLEKYESDILDVDILRVGHHGSHNATTEAFMEAVSPTHAIISCGKWTYGRGTTGMFTTYAYGHPRISVLDILQGFLNDDRSTSLTIKGGVKSRQFKNYLVSKRIYATPWDETIQIKANADGTYVVTRNH